MRHPSRPMCESPIPADSRAFSGRAGLMVTLIVVCAAAAFQAIALAEEMYWASGFAPIALAPISTRNGSSEGSSSATLVLTGDVELTADNTPTAQLASAGGCRLVTEYRLAFDGNGNSATGAADTSYVSYDHFLDPALRIVHVIGDDDVQVTLWVRARSDVSSVPDSGDYSATQTITAAWVGP